MTSEHNPSGLPGGRILRPVYGPRELDVDLQLARQHEGLPRVRRTLIVASGLVGALAVVVLLVNGSDVAGGIARTWLAPTLIILAIVEGVARFTSTGHAARQ